MLLISIGKTSFRVKVSATDRIFTKSNARAHCKFEAVVRRKKIPITMNWIQALDLMRSFWQCYGQTPQK